MLVYIYVSLSVYMYTCAVRAARAVRAVHAMRAVRATTGATPGD